MTYIINFVKNKTCLYPNKNLQCISVKLAMYPKNQVPIRLKPDIRHRLKDLFAGAIAILFIRGYPSLRFRGCDDCSNDVV